VLIVDTGPLVATADRADKDHEACRQLLESDEGPLVTTADWQRIQDLVSTYADLRLGGTDALVVALAERHGAVRIATLNRRHFAVVRPRHAEAFELLP
jgi:uncharacterized protein